MPPQFLKSALHIPVLNFCANRVLKGSCSFDIKKHGAYLGATIGFQYPKVSISLNIANFIPRVSRKTVLTT